MSNIPNERPITITSIDGMKLDAALAPASAPRGSILLAHGFSVDHHEQGVFDVLTAALVNAGISVVRFTFRGHGKSDGTQPGLTISGMRLDLTAAYHWMVGNLPGPYALLGASFGGVSTTLQMASLHPTPTCFVLWNPALEIGEVFGAERLAEAREKGWVSPHNDYRIGQVLLEERALFKQNLAVERLGMVPTLIIHGDNDVLVPIETARNAAKVPLVELFEIPGAAHGFHAPWEEEIAVKKTVEWVVANLK